MTSNSQMPSKKDRPFPWLCHACGRREMFPRATDYTSTRAHDGHLYEIHIPDLEIPTCNNCGERLITSKADDRMIAAFREKAGLLTPEEMQCKREELGLSRNQMAELLGIPEKTVSDWEEGMRIQSREMDDLMRSYFARLDIEQTPRGLDQFGLTEASSGS